MSLKHGVTAYKRNVCRCKKCRDANTDYERKRRHQRQGQKMIRGPLDLEEYKKFKEGE